MLQGTQTLGNLVTYKSHMFGSFWSQMNTTINCRSVGFYSLKCPFCGIFLIQNAVLTWNADILDILHPIPAKPHWMGWSVLWGSRKKTSLSHPKLELCPKTLFFCSLVQKTTTRGRASSKKYHQGGQGDGLMCTWGPRENPMSLSCPKTELLKKYIFGIFILSFLKKILNKKIRVGHF